MKSNIPATLVTIGGIANQSDATVKKDTIAIGTQSNYFIDENTTFYFISGTAAEPTVQTVTGKTALLGDGDTYVLPANSVVSASVLNYSNNIAANMHVDSVLVKAPYQANVASDLYYVAKGETVTTNLTSGNNSMIYVRNNDQMKSIWVATSAVSGIATSGKASNDMFYTHVADRAGVEALTAVSGDTGAIKAYYSKEVNFAGTYGAYLTSGSSNDIVNRIASNAKVVDLREAVVNGYDTNSKAYVGTSVTGTIDTVEKLINASANYSFKVDAAGTSGGVTVVYIKSATQRELSHGVTFEVKKADGTDATTPSQYYTVLGRATGANGGAAVNDTVYFTLTDAAKGATVTAKVGTAAATTLTAAPIYVNGVSYANGYKVTITDNTVITITLAAPAVSVVNYQLTIVGEDGVTTKTYDLGAYTDTAKQEGPVTWETVCKLVNGTDTNSKWVSANGAKTILTAQGINESANIGSITVNVATGATGTYQFVYAKSVSSNP